MKNLLNILFGVLFLGYLLSCEDDKYLSSANAKLRFSVDTLMFDTIFTTIGSTTHHLKIYNPYDQKVLISSIKLARGASSNFRLNINGISSDEVKNMELAPLDSMYIFVEVTIDPTRQNLPLVVKDSIEFVTNNNLQDVNLLAWGQDFKLIKGNITKNANWTSEKPYLVYTDSYVDSLSTLTIEPGTKIYFHKEAGLHIEGKVVAKGTVDNPIRFTCDRLDEAYQNVPDQWDGITLYPGSKSNEFSNVEIKNANIGLLIGNVGKKTSDVKLNNVKIQNMAYAGIFAVQSDVTAINCLITNCGYYALALLVSGSYEFNQSTIANYWPDRYGFKPRTTASVYISNILTLAKDKKDYVGDITKANFSNCIVTGNLTGGNELYFKSKPENLFNYKFNRCVLQFDDKSSPFKDTQHYLNCFTIHKDSIFADPSKYNFDLDSLSRAKDSADKAIAKIYPTDLRGTNRFLDAGPDIGALERQEKKSKK